MSAVRPFRFCTYRPVVTSGEELAAFARKVEAQGYSTLAVGEHAGFGITGPLVTLATAAAATTTLRLAAHVFNNELRHPALVAGELAMLDVLSGGRVEIGIGAGWLRSDFSVLGVPFDRASVRIARLEEAVRLIKLLFAGEPVTFSGSSYQLQELTMTPKVVQRPHPPIFIGGGGRRMLTLAAQEAQIIGLEAVGTPQGAKDQSTGTGESFGQKAAWVRELLGPRLAEVEFHVLSLGNKVTDQRQRDAEEMAAWFNSFPSDILANNAWDAESILESPQALIGSVEQICEVLRERRELYGISYITVPGDQADMFAPVVAQLAGT